MKTKKTTKQTKQAHVTVLPPFEGSLPGLHLTSNAAEFDESMNLETYQAIGESLKNQFSSSAWQLADWAAFGAKKFPDSYKGAAAAIGISSGALQNMATVSRRFPTLADRKFPNLTFEHYRLLAPLKNRDEGAFESLASRADDEELTTAALKTLIPKPTKPEEPAPPPEIAKARAETARVATETEMMLSAKKFLAWLHSEALHKNESTAMLLVDSRIWTPLIDDIGVALASFDEALRHDRITREEAAAS